MKILLRKWEGEFYVWKTAEYRNDEYYVDDKIIHQTRILSVKEHDANEYVICNSCGKKVKNDPESIERHYVEQEEQKNCLTCQHCIPYSIKYEKKNYIPVPNEDGVYECVTTKKARLKCRMSYSNIDIHDLAVSHYCKFMQCRRSGMHSFGDILMNHPNLFEKQITVDALREKGYVYAGNTCQDRYGDKYFRYDMKCRGTVWACVNEYGIVDHFEVSYRYNVYHVYYSATQHKIFFNQSYRYSENKPYNLSDAKMRFLMEKIPELYKEAKANE